MLFSAAAARDDMNGTITAHCRVIGHTQGPVVYPHGVRLDMSWTLAVHMISCMTIALIPKFITFDTHYFVPINSLHWPCTRSDHI